LTHPDGLPVGVKSILGLDLRQFDRIIFVGLREHENKYKYEPIFSSYLKEFANVEIEFLQLDSETHSQAETVFKAIEKFSIKGLIFIKDGDGYFEYKEIYKSNKVVFSNIHENQIMEPKSKSYIVIDKNGLIDSIAEKTIISENFCVGGYIFEDSNEFLSHFKKIESQKTEKYLSSIILSMILSGKKFESSKVDKFLDWGTEKEWRSYISNYATFFVDIDGTLITSTSKNHVPYHGTGMPILENIKYINNKYNEGRTKIILTTSRPESTRQETINELNKNKIKFHQLIMGLYNSKRLLINDYASSNPFPSAIAINLRRNDDNLPELLS
jgi:hypothetical protein